VIGSPSAGVTIQNVTAFMKLMASTSSLALIMALAISGAALAPQALAANGMKPALVISNDPLPTNLQNQVYGSSRVQDITPSQVTGASYFDDSATTPVGRKVEELRNELFSLQGTVSKLSENLAQYQNSGRSQAAEYYASVATISTQLQAGTTPGNPRLVQRLHVARDNLEKLSGNIAQLNDLAVQISNAASVSSYLLESARATYGLSGAVEEDHIRLAQLEDSVNSTIVIIDRLLNNINDDITRTVAYLGTERENLRTLSLAITTGDLFGKSLANRPFSGAQQASFAAEPTSAYSGSSMGTITATPLAPTSLARAPAAVPGGRRPLVKIRFDRPDVSYQQPVYMAVSQALQRYPDARFDLVAVNPQKGNAAEVAIESTRARRNAERVLRSLTEMGVDTNKVDLSYAPSANATTSEVHLYIH